jgi:hypothetical protein
MRPKAFFLASHVRPGVFCGASHVRLKAFYVVYAACRDAPKAEG